MSKEVINSADTQESVFPKKLKNKLPTGFEEDCMSMSEEDLKKRVIEFEGHLYTLDKELDENDKINSAKELIKEESAPYRESKGIENAKIKYIFFVLESRGIRI